jgi:NTP pyrophosphatase (non-canonical NTP hydrolase)
MEQKVQNLFSQEGKLSILGLQEEVHAWIQTVGVRYFNELTNLGILMEEVGELSRIMVRKFGEQSWKEGDPKQLLADEMADVLWVLVCLANQTGINLEEAIQKNIEKKTNRDLHRHKNNPKLSAGEGNAERNPGSA